jgi:hypothetical protein
MNRREAISAVAFLLGGTIVGSNIFLTGCRSDEKKSGEIKFDESHIAMLDEVGETILPATSTPGAKAAKIGSFMAMMVTDCYEPENQKVFMEGIDKIDDASDKKFNKAFMEVTPQQRHELLAALDKEQNDYMKNKKPDEASHYFRMMKELTMMGYFTSEVGASKALRFMESPGKYEGCTPYAKGEKAWAI